MSQTNSLKLMEPLPSWSISPISSWQKVVDCPFFCNDFHIFVPWQSLKKTAEKSAPDKGIVDICHHRQIWQISAPDMRITALMEISQKVKQLLDLDEEKRTKQNQNEAKQTKQNPKKTKRNAQGNLQLQVWRAPPKGAHHLVERERVIIHEDEDSISTRKPLQIYKKTFKRLEPVLPET